MHEVSGWISLGAELGDGEEKEGEVIPQVSWYLVLLVVLLCGALIDRFGCQEEESVWLALQTCDAHARFFSFHPLETNTGSS